MRSMLAAAAFSLSLCSTSAVAQRAGNLISAEAVVETPGRMQAWRIVYWTTSDTDKLIRVTGMVRATRSHSTTAT